MKAMNRGLAKSLAAGMSLALIITSMTACKRAAPAEPNTPTQAHTDADGHDHDAMAGHDHDDHAPADGHGQADDHHADEVSLGSAHLGDITVDCWQSHGSIAPGKELHLVVKLPYTDNGATTVRAWIGSENRIASTVAKAEYAPGHDDYDVHCEAPSPLPTGAMWWIEVEKPDGSRHLGSVAPL